MKGATSCPRCGATVRPPSAWTTRWTCPVHGEVYPIPAYGHPSAQLARHLSGRSSLPLWLPWPLPRGWVVSALFCVGDDVSGVRATAAALSGPNPMGGPADLLLVAEEPGVGLGARYAGLPGTDPGDALREQSPVTKLTVGGRPTALWPVASHDGVAALAGESHGLWLWLLLRPASASMLLLDQPALADVRDLGDEVDLVPFGALPPWLQPA